MYKKKKASPVKQRKIRKDIKLPKFEEIDDLSYRQMQKICVHFGLPAAKKKVILQASIKKMCKSQKRKGKLLVAAKPEKLTKRSQKKKAKSTSKKEAKDINKKSVKTTRKKSQSKSVKSTKRSNAKVAKSTVKKATKNTKNKKIKITNKKTANTSSKKSRSYTRKKSTKTSTEKSKRVLSEEPVKTTSKRRTKSKGMKPDSKKSKKEKIKEKILKKNKTNGNANIRVKKKGGFVMTFGTGTVGQLGQLDEDDDYPVQQLLPMQEKQRISDVIQICAGDIHSACLRADGEVFTWGCNDDSALGRDPTRDGVREGLAGPVLELRGKNVEQLTAGASHMLARTLDGKVYAWGAYRDECGKMAIIGKQGLPPLQTTQENESSDDDDSDAEPPRPQMLPGLVVDLENKHIVDIASTSNCSVAVEDTGNVWVWGTHLFNCSRRRDEALKIEQLKLPTGVVIKQAFGAETSLSLLDKDNMLWVVGSNGCGQLGLNPDEGENYAQANLNEPLQHPLGQKVSKFTPGGQHGLLLTSGGEVYSSGCVYDGRLGHGKAKGKAKYEYCPTLIRHLQKDSDDSVLEEDDEVTDVACGYAHSLAITKKGYLYAWGSNECACLGHSSEEDVFFPKLVNGKKFDDNYIVDQVDAGSQHTIILAHRRSQSNRRKATPRRYKFSYSSNGLESKKSSQSQGDGSKKEKFEKVEEKSSGFNAFAALINPDNWTCEICLVSNNKNLIKCGACETFKPGHETTSHQENGGVFNASSTTNNTKKFTFGSTDTDASNSLINNSSSNSFTFGSDSNSSTTAGKFTFGSTSPIKSNMSNNNSSTNSFTFGSTGNTCTFGSAEKSFTFGSDTNIQTTNTHDTKFTFGN